VICKGTVASVIPRRTGLFWTENLVFFYEWSNLLPYNEISFLMDNTTDYLLFGIIPIAFFYYKKFHLIFFNYYFLAKLLTFSVSNLAKNQRKSTQYVLSFSCISLYPLRFPTDVFPTPINCDFPTEISPKARNFNFQNFSQRLLTDRLAALATSAVLAVIT